MHSKLYHSNHSTCNAQPGRCVMRKTFVKSLGPRNGPRLHQTECDRDLSIRTSRSVVWCKVLSRVGPYTSLPTETWNLWKINCKSLWALRTVSHCRIHSFVLSLGGELLEKKSKMRIKPCQTYKYVFTILYLSCVPSCTPTGGSSVKLSYQWLQPQSDNASSPKTLTFFTAWALSIIWWKRLEKYPVISSQ